jgi:hypothetical protein
MQALESESVRLVRHKGLKRLLIGAVAVPGACAALVAVFTLVVSNGRSSGVKPLVAGLMLFGVLGLIYAYQGGYQLATGREIDINAGFSQPGVGLFLLGYFVYIVAVVGGALYVLLHTHGI